MKVSVELSENELKEIIRHAGVKKKGPAIRKFLVDGLMLRRRRDLSRKVLSGETTVEFPNWEKLREMGEQSPWTQ